jgi:hypothetical protein
MWIAYRVERGQTADSPSFTDVAMNRFVTRLNELYELRASDDTTGGVSSPPKLKSFEEWETWIELLETHLSHVRNSTLGTPFTYLIRDELPDMDVATRNQFLNAAAAGPIDEDLISTTRTTGPSFQRDNHTLFDLLKVLSIDGSCWNFIEQYKTTRNGRAAFLMLKKQAEGDYAQTAKKNQAYLLIEKAHFSGKGKFTLAQYTSVHQSAHNKLEACGEPVPETKKVTDYLLGITADALATAKNITHSRNDLSTDFSACQQFMLSTYGKMQVVKGGSRSIGGVSQEPQKKRFEKRQPFHKKKGNHKSSSSNKNRHYPPAEWAKMMESGEAQKILEARKAKTEQRRTSAVKQDATFAVTLAEIAKTVSALAAKSAVTIGSVTSKAEDDTSLSVITAATPTAGRNGQETAPPAANDKKKHPPGEITKARQESAGGQFGRNGIGNLKKTSFPDAAVKQAKGVAISSVKTIDTEQVQAPPVALFREGEPTDVVQTPANWLKPKGKKPPSPRRNMELPTQKRKKGQPDSREKKPRKAKEPSESK